VHRRVPITYMTLLADVPDGKNKLRPMTRFAGEPDQTGWSEPVGDRNNSRPKVAFLPGQARVPERRSWSPRTTIMRGQRTRGTSRPAGPDRDRDDSRSTSGFLPGIHRCPLTDMPSPNSLPEVPDMNEPSTDDQKDVHAPDTQDTMSRKYKC
jgi:hypothetical protein